MYHSHLKRVGGGGGGGGWGSKEEGKGRKEKECFARGGFLFLFFISNAWRGGGGRRKGDKKMRKYFVLQSTKSIDKMYKILTGLRASKEDRRFQG